MDAKGLCASPEEFGDYFAWGEKEPYYAEGNADMSPCSDWRLGKTGYDWGSYKWCNGAKDKLTKYCPVPPQGQLAHTDSSRMECARRTVPFGMDK